MEVYHINDYHGALAPVYLLPDTIPCCLSLHNAEFQGLWPMRTPKESREVCEVYNVGPEVAQNYPQFGEVFNLLHAGASYLRIHQKGFGAVGVSKKYGKRSLARYPIFWGLTKIGKLPNPDPTDTGDFDPNAAKSDDVPIDEEFERGRAELKRQAQDWAGLEQNPAAELLVFVGRWSMQKGVDLIADIMPAVLEENENVQLICVGPVIDLYGKFAALKLERLMQIHPKRVFSKPEFTALPPFIFSGAEFALIPSRDEPFGLVAVEFGRKGALGIGARVGGLGQMPGWWFTVESTSTTHLIHQFKSACKEALACKPEIRAKMRARSAKQRFPVVKWVEDLETLQSTAISIHSKVKTASPYLGVSRPTTSRGPAPPMLRMSSGMSTASGAVTPGGTLSPSDALTPARPARPADSLYGGPTSPMEEEEEARNSAYDPYMAFRAGPYQQGMNADELQQHVQALERRIGFAVTDDMDPDDAAHYRDSFIHDYTVGRLEGRDDGGLDVETPPVTPGLAVNRIADSPSSSMLPPPSPMAEDHLMPPAPLIKEKNLSTLSLDSVVGTRKDFMLQKVDPSFTDKTGEFYNAFEKKLEGLDGKSSEDQLCIEDYLVKSEKKWFGRFRDAKLGRSHGGSAASSVYRMKRDDRPISDGNEYVSHQLATAGKGWTLQSPSDEFLLDENYVPPRGLRKFMQYRIGDWPVYSFFMAFVSCPVEQLLPCCQVGGAGVADDRAGSDYCGELVSDHAADGRGWPGGREAVHDREHLPGLVDPLVVHVPTAKVGLFAIDTLHLLRHGLLLHRHVAAGRQHERTWMGSERGYGLLCHGREQRFHLLRVELW